MTDLNKYPLLSKVNLPSDLRKLPLEQLPQLCDELRRDIIEELSTNPGHLASSLGVVEITVALHYVFDTPYDRIVWDVGHQAYGHKILTGRRDKFYTNRKFKGICPFPTPLESEYDTFACGHASNSISAALGMAVAAQAAKVRGERLEVRDKHIVAVIGDGAMSGGLAFEGLNNVSSTPNDMLIILNDNDMSIDRAVGGMEKYLLKLNTNKTYNDLRYKMSNWLGSTGHLDKERRNAILRLSNAFKSVLSHQQNMFEGMNIRYFGAYDGHDVISLVQTLQQIKEMKGPRLLHLHTTKGKGYEPAEQTPTIWHAPGKFDAETGVRSEELKVKSEECEAPKPPKFQDVFGHTLVELAEQNPKVYGVTPAMPTGCSMTFLMQAHPERAFDVGIAEGHAVTFSGGMAKDGLIPFCNIYSAFSQRAYDNIIHDVALLRLPVVLCLDRAGLVGEDGPTLHGAFDMAALRVIPNLTICSPMDEHELRRLMYTAQLPDKGPFVIRYPRGSGSKVDWHCPLEEVKVGTGRKLTDVNVDDNVDDNDNRTAVLTIGPWGQDVEDILTANTQHPTPNTSVVHYDMRFLKPLDEDILKEVAETCTRIITIEDGVRNGGMGTAVMEWLSDHGYSIPVKRLGLPDHFVEHGSVKELREMLGLDKESLKKIINNIN